MPNLTVDFYSDVSHQLAKNDVEAAHDYLKGASSTYDGMLNDINSVGINNNKNILVFVRIIDGVASAEKGKDTSVLNKNFDTAPCAVNLHKAYYLNSQLTHNQVKIPLEDRIAFAHKVSDEPLVYEIKISIQYLQDMLYKSGSALIPMTIERVLAHEMAHVWQDVTGRVTLDAEMTADERTAMEDEAHNKENASMAGLEPPKDCYQSVIHKDPDIPARNVPKKVYRTGDPPEAIPGSEAPDKTLPVNVEDAIGLVGAGKVQPSPLVLDLDGDGVELVALGAIGSVYFDLNGDGFAEATGWISGGDGLLALDVNGDGYINDGSELFGDQSGYSNGFLALAAYDSNSDGVITAEDQIRQRQGIK